MQTIKFLPEFIPLIQHGHKTQSCRPVEFAGAEPIHMFHTVSNKCWEVHRTSSTESVKTYEHRLHPAKYQPGEIVLIHGTDFKIQIASVDVMLLSELEEIEYKNEGFAGKKEFIAAWNKTYPNPPHTSTSEPYVFQYTFKFIGV